MTKERKSDILYDVKFRLMNDYFHASPFNPQMLKDRIVEYFNLLEGLQGAHWATVIRYIPELDREFQIEQMQDALNELQSIIISLE